MVDFYELVKKYYVMGIYTPSDLDDFVAAGKITEVEKGQILASKPD